jgi:alpha-aminoadipate carrier protein LysW
VHLLDRVFEISWKENEMALVTCVECDEEIELNGRPRLGQTLVCISCGAQLEVVSTNPIEVDWADDEGDDWDDEFDDETFDEDDFADDDLAYEDEEEDADEDGIEDDDDSRSWR